MKIGVIVEMFRCPLEEGFRKAAALGVSGIQIYALSKYFDMLNEPDARLKELKTLADAHGLEFAAVCADLGGHGFTDPAGNPARLEKTRRIMERTRFFGTGVLTTHIGVVPTDRNSKIYSEVVEAMREVGRLGAANGITLAIETGPETPEVLKNFLIDVGSPAIAVNMDPANLEMVLNCNSAEAVKTLAGHIVHTHAKDGIHLRPCDPKEVYDAFAEGGFDALVERTGELFREVRLGQGQIDWDAYLQALRDTGFDGFLTVEREVGDDPDAEIAAAVQFLRGKLNL
jgi:sugar phosphate isomerase/epimerase